MQLEFVNLIQVAIATPALTAGALLIQRRRTRALSALLIVFGTHMSLNFAEETGVTPGGFLATPALGALYGPLIYLFVRSMIFKDGYLKPRDFVHTTLAVVALFLSHWLIATRIIAAVATLSYGIAALVLIWRYERASRAVRSDALSLRLNWVVAVFGGFAGLTVLDFFRMATWAHQGPVIRESAYSAILLGAAALFCVLAFRAIKRPRVFAGFTNAEFDIHERVISTTQPDISDVLDAEDKAAFERLERDIREQRLYSAPHLTLAEVASALTLTEREISRLINQVGGRSFCDFINSMRVRQAAQLLRDPANASRTILELSLEAGFTSKSTFNAAFKKELGVTPSVWRRSGNAITSENTYSDDAAPQKS